MNLDAVWPSLPPDAHKGVAGRALCVVGSTAMPGARVLVGRAAQRAGAGLVTLVCLDGIDRAAASVPEAVWVDARREFARDGSVTPGAARRLSEREPHARLAGPGLGDDARTRGVVRALLDLRDDAPLVLDADALNACAGAPERLRTAGAPLVLTPHPGEAARLLGRAIPRDEGGRIEAARELAARTGAVVCLKGRASIVTDGERVGVNATGCEAMATAGSGDVLAGILVAYLARARAARGELDAYEATRLAVRVHGEAGERAAAQHGVDAVVASDLVERLGAVQRAVRAADEPHA